MLLSPGRLFHKELFGRGSTRNELSCWLGCGFGRRKQDARGRENVDPLWVDEAEVIVGDPLWEGAFWLPSMRFDLVCFTDHMKT